MKQTDQYGLNQWELSDRIRMEDFNADNLKIAQALAGKMGRFEEIHTDASDHPSSGTAVNHIIKNWNEWDLFGLFFHPKVLPEHAKVPMRVSMDCNDGQTTTHPEAAILQPDPLLILLFPWHDENRLVEGLIIGGGTKVFRMSFPFKHLGFIRFIPTEDVEPYFSGDYCSRFGVQ